MLADLSQPKRKAPLLAPDEDRVARRLQECLESRSASLSSVFAPKKKVLPTEFYRALDALNSGLSMEDLRAFTEVAATHAAVNIKKAGGDTIRGISVKKASSILAKLPGGAPPIRAQEPPERLDRKVHLLTNQLTE